MDNKTKQQWNNVLSNMLNDYRRINPDDESTDRELLHKLLEHVADSLLESKRINNSEDHPSEMYL
ncbi:MAG: hypothetical protein H6627_09270 [Calditrichae bacterium]|nr:hypothetical protein [Calditrichota bacterium]MCB9058745.1 hypothetical protein [Calditrichia bacterium]